LIQDFGERYNEWEAVNWELRLIVVGEQREIAGGEIYGRPNDVDHGSTVKKREKTNRNKRQTFERSMTKTVGRLKVNKQN